MSDPAVIITRLDDGLPIRLRPITSADRRIIARAYDRLSAQSRYQRFWFRARELNPALIERLTTTHERDHLAWAAVPVVGDDPPGYGAASVWRDEGHPASAELSLTVADEWQDRGIGTLLLALLWLHSQTTGITQFQAHVLTSNLAARAWFESLGAPGTDLNRYWTYHLPLDRSLLSNSSAAQRLETRLVELEFQFTGG